MKTERVTVLEAALDDADGKTLAHAVARLLDEGALDAHLSPLVMKKGRPGHALTVIARPRDAARLARVIFEETPTLGVRVSETRRYVLSRRVEKAKTPHGSVRVKVSPFGAEPEFEDCAALARKTKTPLRTVAEAARKARRGRK